MGQHQVIDRPRQSSAMFLSPVFITKERCQLLTATDDKQMTKASEYLPEKSDRKKKLSFSQ